MSLKALWITSDFPKTLESARNLYLWHSLEALKKQGIETIVLNVQSWRPFQKTSISKSNFSIKIINCNYISIPRYYFRAASNLFYLIRTIYIIKKLYKENQFNIIHAHGEINGLAAVKAAKKLKIPAVVTIHGIETCKRMCKGLSGKMFFNMYNQADRIIYVGEPLQKHFQKIIINKYNIVHNGFKVPENNSNKKKSDVIRIISVGFLQEGKGVDLVLLALAQLKKNNILNWVYTIIGTGPQKNYLEKIITDFNLESQVEFKGDCSHSEVYTYLQQSDIFCLPSYREAFGIAYLEAMAHGLLTIGIKGQGPEAFIKHAKTGFLAEPKSVDSLVEILGPTVIHFEKMQPIAALGKQYVFENFTWEKHAKKLRKIYEELQN